MNRERSKFAIEPGSLHGVAPAYMVDRVDLPLCNTFHPVDPYLCLGVPEHLTLTASDEPAVALRGCHRRRCVNVCMNKKMLGNIVESFEWPLPREARYQYIPFSIYYFTISDFLPLKQGVCGPFQSIL